MTAIKLFTVEDVEHLACEGEEYELIRGELIAVSLRGRLHGRVAGATFMPLYLHVIQNDAGEVYQGVGFILHRDPDVLLGPDVSFVRAERLRDAGEDGFLPLVPDLAVEVISPTERRAKIERKIAEYRAAGVPLLLILRPRQRTVTVYEPDRPPRTLREDDTLDGGSVLPGFTLPVREIFA
ncbi:MAG TPA: Uma2 family endonuclease [Dehalococcoidia bacterium]|nr:Uma2 family endonuclease [Dehalococcoidia bacterium]